MKQSDRSRRTFLRAVGMLTGSAVALRYAPDGLASASGHWPQGAQGQADALAAARAQIGAAPITSAPLTDRLLLLSGPGGNVVVLHGPDGKVLVDAFVQPAWQNLKKTLDAIDGSAVRTLIDTHWHFDHADNNANVRSAGARVLAHENTAKRLKQAHDVAGMHIDPAPAEALPTQTFASTFSVRANGEEVALSHVPPAHTDTDVFVHFRKANVLHLGDVYFNGMYPFIDASTGGTINGTIAAADRALGIANADTKVVPGHGPLGDRKSLETYRTMLATVRDRVKTHKAAGKTLAEVQAATPSAEFDSTWGQGMMKPADFIAIVYDTL